MPVPDNLVVGSKRQRELLWLRVGFKCHSGSREKAFNPNKSDCKTAQSVAQESVTMLVKELPEKI